MDVFVECDEANIVSIDYDPSATWVNQENRIKLMLAVASERIGDGAENHAEKTEEKIQAETKPETDSQPEKVQENTSQNN